MPQSENTNTVDLGYRGANCRKTHAYGQKAVDFKMKNLPDGHSEDQYFVICVPERTREDRKAKALFPSGEIAPRLIKCPEGLVYNRRQLRCEERRG